MCFVIVSLLSQSSLQSSPLRFVPQTVKQPTGEIVRCYASGDEYFSWLHDKDGFTIVQDEKGFYVYAARANGLLVPTDNVVGKSDPQYLGMQKWLKPEKQYIMEKVETLISSKSQLGKNSGRTSTVSAPTKGTLNNLVIFIRFSDESEFTESLAVFDAMFNNTQSTANSLYNYYNEVSYGQLQIRSKFYPVSGNNSIKSYFDSNPRNYYNVYSVTNPIGYKTGIEKSGREQTLLANAIGFIQKDITPADNFDGDQDGNIDNVCFIVKGAPEVWASTLWPHMWSLDSRNVLVNGKKVTTYNFQLERNLLDLGVGVLSHEMFHSLGAPDLYHYSLDEMNPVASWDLMEITSNPPQHMGAYMKYRYGHWITSIPEISNAGTYYLQPLISSKQNSFKIASPNSNSEYYVLEYRKQKGVFDKSVPSEGLLVYRINQTSDGQGNAVVASDEAYIFRPGGTSSSNGEPDKASFSSNSGRTSINDFSNPSSVLSNNLPGGLDLYEVGSLSDSISFKIKKPKAYTLALTSPIGGENFKINGQTNITWNNASVSDIKIELSLDSVKWQEIATVKGQSGVNQGQFLWKIPSQPTTTGKIRISDLNDVSSYSFSRNYFAISTNGQLFEVEPNNTKAEATPIARGDSFEGNIDPEGEADYYRFTASAGDTIDVFAGAVNSTLRGRILLLNDAGVLGFDDGLYNGLITNQRFSFLMPATGVYYIRYAYRENYGPASGRLIDSRPDSYQTYSSNLNNLSNSTTGGYRISLQKFKSSPPDFSGFGGAWNVTLNSATLQWYVQENGCVSKYTFEYGTTNYYGNEIDAHTYAPSYQETFAITPKITSLLPNTTYHFRIRAENKFGTFYSRDQVFTTAKESDNWERQLVDGEVPFAQYFPFSETSGVAIAAEFMFKTSDGGLSWGEKIRFPNNFMASGASFTSINNGWIVGDGIYRTTDGGASWSKQNKPTSKWLRSVCFVDGNNGWAVGMQGVIIHTSDGGTNWIVQDPGYNGELWEGLYAVAFCDLKNGIASGTTGSLLKTTE